MTFSYNYFHDHDKSCLFGKGNSDIYDGCRTISFHHNFFYNIQGSRLPQQRGGHMHYYNNYMKGCQDGYRLNDQATGYIEACYLEILSLLSCQRVKRVSMSTRQMVMM